MPRFGLSYEDDDDDDDAEPIFYRGTAPAAMSSPPLASSSRSSTSRSKNYQQQLQFGSSGGGSSHGVGASRGAAAAAAATSPAAAAPATPSSSAALSSSSVGLSCLGFDGKSWHSLVRDGTSGVYMIESNIMISQSLAELDEEENNNNATGTGTVIWTPLPQLCQSVFRVDAPCELLCVGGGGGRGGGGGGRQGQQKKHTNYQENDSRNEEEEEQQQQQTSLGSLCVYASRAVFLLDIVYSPAAAAVDYNSSDIIQGQVRCLTEPFERHLLDAGYSTRIVRVRAAPQRNNGGGSSSSNWGVAVHCPAKCLAMLTEDRESNLYQLALLEGSNGAVKVPLSFQTEDLVGMEEQRIVDFCFAQCCNNGGGSGSSIGGGLSLLASLSILLVKGSGDVLAATPIVFDGAIVPRPDYQQVLDYLKAAKEEYNNVQQQLQQQQDNDQSQSEQQRRAGAKWRQCRAAERYLMDVFPSLDARSYFLTAKTNNVGPASSVLWPVQIQGPVLFQSQVQDDDDYNNTASSSTSSHTADPLALTIESFGNTEVVGFAVGRRQGGVDIGVLSPTVLIPRFQMELRRDTYDIDDDVCRYSSWVERVSLGMDFPNATSNARLRFLRDPAVDSFLHVVMAKAVCTISTNAVALATRHLMGAFSHTTTSPSQAVKTTAWTCLTAASGASIHGAVVTDSATNGHQLLVRLADGSIAETNVDEQRYAHDLANMTAFNAKNVLVPSSTGASSSQAALERLDAVPPFYESVQPLVKQIQSGLASMGKIVGSETKCRDITPDTLAVAVAVKERCEKQVVLPLMQLRKLTDSRRVALQQMAQTLQQEVESLLTVVAVDMHDRTRLVCARMQVAEVNALTLSQRSQAAMQTSQSLGPAITQAEREFFKFVDLTQAKCEAWDRKAKKLEAGVKRQVESLGENKAEHNIQLNLNQVDVRRLHTLLDQQGEMLNKPRLRLQQTQRRLQELTRKAGLQLDALTSSSRENQASTGNTPY